MIYIYTKVGGNEIYSSDIRFAVVSSSAGGLKGTKLITFFFFIKMS